MRTRNRVKIKSAQFAGAQFEVDIDKKQEILQQKMFELDDLENRRSVVILNVFSKLRREVCMSRLTAISLLLLVVVPVEIPAEEGGSSNGPLPETQVQQLKQSLEQKLDDASKRMKENPKSVDSYSRLGDAHFFLGQFKEAVTDYDKMIEIDEGLSASHWRRGIALFYAEKYKDAAAQFESYHSFDQVDRENGIWRYLSQHRAYGREKAREGLLKYQKDDREPFPSVYQLFAGKMTPREILAKIEAADLAKLERESRLFYAHLYIGLNHSVEGDDELARENLAAATRNKWPITAGYGPNFMWHVGRLHEEMLRKKSEN